MSFIAVLPEEILQKLAPAEADAVRALPGDEAIDELHRINRAERSDDREIALRDARIFVGEILKARPAPTEEPVFDQTDVSLQHTADGVPFVPTDQLSLAALTTAFEETGCLLVKGVASAERCAEMRAKIEATMDAIETEADAPALVSPPLASLGHADLGFDRGWTRSNGGTITVDSPHLLANLVDIFGDAGIVELAQQYTHGRCALSAHKAYIRRFAAEGSLDNGWHQDGAFIGSTRVLNAWLTFSDAGREAPGMELLLKRMDEIKQGKDGKDFQWSLSPADVDTMSDGAPTVIPFFEAGDALLFDQLFVHRTHRIAGMTQPRYSTETWFFAPETLRDDYTAILV